jgi:hypothetical protein
MNPAITSSSATSFQSKLPAGKIIGEKAIPIALKNATTHPVHPNVRSPKINVKNGIAFEPFGSTFVNR